MHDALIFSSIDSPEIIDSPELMKHVTMDTTYNSLQAVPGKVKIDPPSAAPVIEDV